MCEESRGENGGGGGAKGGQQFVCLFVPKIRLCARKEKWITSFKGDHHEELK